MHHNNIVLNPETAKLSDDVRDCFYDALNSLYYVRVPTNSGNHGKPGKSLKKVPCMEKSWNLKKPE